MAEHGRYAIYTISETNNGAWWFSEGKQFTLEAAIPRPGERLLAVREADPGVKALVTDDAYLIDFHAGAASLAGPVSGPFESRNAVFGPALADLQSRQQFEREYELALRDAAFVALDNSQQVAGEMQQRLFASQFQPEDRKAMLRVATQLQKLDEAIAKTETALRGARADSLHAMEITLTGEVPEAVADLEQKLADLQMQRIQAAHEFPLLLRVDDLAKFMKLPEQEQVKALSRHVHGVLKDIQTTRQNLMDGDFNLWGNQALLATVNRGLGISGERLQWVENRVAHEQHIEALASISVDIGLAAVGALLAPVSGGSSLAATVARWGMRAGAVGFGLYDANDAIQDYRRDKAAANTALDPNAGLLPPEQAGHWGWVALAWIGLGMDAAEAVAAVSKLARAGHSVADVIKDGSQLYEIAQTAGIPADELLRVLDSHGVNVGDFSTTQIPPREFLERFGVQSGEGVTLVHQGPDGQLRLEVVFREGLTPDERMAVLSEETLHLSQLARDPQRAALLSEERLAHWPNMSAQERMQSYEANLQFEIEAQRLLAGKANQSLDDAHDVRQRLEHLEGQLDDIRKGLLNGQPPDWLAHAPAPRLFADPIYPINNARAQSLGMPAPPEGHYYRDLGNDRYELTRFGPNSSQYADPKRSPPQRAVQNPDGSWRLEPKGTITASQRRQEIEQRFREPVNSETGRRLEQNLDSLKIDSPFVRAYARMHSSALASLDNLSPGRSRKVLAQLAKLTEDSAAEENLRRALRAETVQAIRALPDTEQLKVLDDMAHALPSNGERGALFTAYREQAMPPNLTVREPATGGLTVSSTRRRADGVVDVSDEFALPGIGPKAGSYLAEDKYGKSFDIEQARAYSQALDEGSGKIKMGDGSEHQGVVYFFSNKQQADKAMKEIGESNLNANIHIAIIKNPAELEWLR
ncbi:hypothetical protein EII20_09655 [Comamonadaceae bacterium OH2545_COT-014]|nr:hypothetical protein EII20_09655 [Comamonadaceae bacterium OH2545_COT-014]